MSNFRASLADVARLAVKMGWDYLIVDGVHVPTVTFGRKTAGQEAYYSGKHKRHGLNVQTGCSPDGELLWAAAPRPGATVDITAAREAEMSPAQRAANRLQAQLRRMGERAAERLRAAACPAPASPRPAPRASTAAQLAVLSFPRTSPDGPATIRTRAT